MGCSWWSIGSVQVVFLMWSSSTSWKTIANTVKHQQLIISINFGISSIFKFQAYSSIDYRPAIHRDTTSCTTSSHSHTPVDCLKKKYRKAVRWCASLTWLILLIWLFWMIWLMKLNYNNIFRLDQISCSFRMIRSITISHGSRFCEILHQNHNIS